MKRAQHFRTIISIHAPPRGATPQGQEEPAYTRNFNSRPSARGDGSRPLYGAPRMISIHAPPRGATQQCPIKRSSASKFQFTPLREGRQEGLVAILHLLDFNSRPSARGDANVYADVAGFPISIHAPPRGATMQELGLDPADTISIHAPPRGATLGKRRRLSAFQISIHAPPRGATSAGGLPTAPAVYFNSRPSARGDLQGKRCRKATKISIHAPPRGATGCWRRFNPPDEISIHAPPRGATPRQPPRG